MRFTPPSARLAELSVALTLLFVNYIGTAFPVIKLASVCSAVAFVNS